MSIHPTIIQMSAEPRKPQPPTQGYQISLVPPLLILQLEPKCRPKTVSYADSICRLILRLGIEIRAPSREDGN